MGSLLGTVIGHVVDAIGDAVERRALAKGLRSVATKIERGEIVPDELLAKARETSAAIADAREKYKR